MNLLARRLFQELADLTPAEREKIFAEREIETDLRAEVESLLDFDLTSDQALATRVSRAAQAALHSGENAELSHCGPYRVVRLLGSGGMGSVYLAERSDGELQQQVAVKLLRAGADTPAWRARFLRERQLLASLSHASIARVMDAGHTADGRPYLVMEYVNGIPIDEYGSALDLRERLKIFLNVCDAVSHAHSQLIIHRDLKPSNILVNDSGLPKLLDFGIAKLLDEVAESTQTVEQLLTPNYASPEQLLGAPQTTATDVYSLGAVLSKLLTGQLAHERAEGVGQKLPRDLDFVIRKALRDEPKQRYASVEAFANDLRFFLESRPVQARAGDAWYRAQKFLRRYTAQVLAATLAIAGLSAGLWVANRERAVAQRRFDQVRQLANKVLKLDASIRGLPGSTKARHEIVAMSQEYLEALRSESSTDKDLALEIGTAYLVLANAQGVPTSANLGQYAEAKRSLLKADALLEPVLTATPQNRKALLATAEVAHARMILAETDHRREEALAQAYKTAARLDSLIGLGHLSDGETNRVAQMFGNIALSHKNMHRFEDSIRYARRTIAIAQNVGPAQRYVGSALGIEADCLRSTGDLEGAYRAITEAVSLVEKASFDDEIARRAALISALWREGLILGAAGDVSLKRYAEAIQVQQQAFRMAEEWAQKDPSDARSRGLLQSAARELGALLNCLEPARALAIYDHALFRLAEIQGTSMSNREQVPLLAGSSYALRRMRRPADARQRIDKAFDLLHAIKAYPTDRVSPGQETDAAIRALADHLSETGEPREAEKVYQQLLDKTMASNPEPQRDLRHAVKLSSIYEALARLHRTNGKLDEAEQMTGLRLALWRHWEEKLPRNAFVVSQLRSASLP